MKKGKLLLFGIIVIGCVGLGIYNIIFNCNFFKVPIYAIANILIAVFIAYYLNQLKHDERKKKEFVSIVINRLIAMASDKMVCIAEEEDITFISMTQREFNNKVRLLREYDGDKIYKDGLDYIERELKEYWDFISNYINDLNYLQSSRKILHKYITNIRSKLEEMEWYLYK